MDKIIKPKFEDAINELLLGDVQENAQNFVAWLRKNKLSPTWFRVTSYIQSKTWHVKYKGKNICVINMVFDGSLIGYWNVLFNADNLDNECLLTDDYKNIAWRNIKYCGNCGSCKPGYSMSIFGKDFDNICGRALTFYNPRADEIECIKLLIQINGDFINANYEVQIHNSVPNPAYVAEQQKNCKIEHYVPENVNSGIKKISQDLIVYLQSNKMTSKYSALNRWDINYMGLICSIKLPYHGQNRMFSLAIGLHLINMNKYKDEIINESLQNFFWDSLNFCKGCTPKCTPLKCATVLEKEIMGICINCEVSSIWIYDPNEVALNGIKRLLELEKHARVKKI